MIVFWEIFHSKKCDVGKWDVAIPLINFCLKWAKNMDFLIFVLEYKVPLDMDRSK
jgi:hypothetical protein